MVKKPLELYYYILQQQQKVHYSIVACAFYHIDIIMDENKTQSKISASHDSDSNKTIILAKDISILRMSKNRSSWNCCFCISDAVRRESWIEVICSHRFHAYCFYAWISKNTTCPLCRADLTYKSVIGKTPLLVSSLVKTPGINIVKNNPIHICLFV